jgi:hypothetical protein
MLVSFYFLPDGSTQERSKIRRATCTLRPDLLPRARAANIVAYYPYSSHLTVNPTDYNLSGISLLAVSACASTLESSVIFVENAVRLRHTLCKVLANTRGIPTD